MVPYEIHHLLKKYAFYLKDQLFFGFSYDAKDNYFEETRQFINFAKIPDERVRFNAKKLKIALKEWFLKKHCFYQQSVLSTPKEPRQLFLFFLTVLPDW